MDNERMRAKVHAGRARQSSARRATICKTGAHKVAQGSGTGVPPVRLDRHRTEQAGRLCHYSVNTLGQVRSARFTGGVVAARQPLPFAKNGDATLSITVI